ncbi:MAG: TetR/AcrR family transcriptional regulator [Alphaproteobacteria bacterium]
MPTAPISPRKTPRQSRSRDTVETILEAAARVLERSSLEGFNTNRVAEVAGVSVGSVYQYFPNKDALMAALIERAQDGLAGAIERVVERCERESLEVALDAVAEVVVAHQYERPLLAAAIDREEIRLPVATTLLGGEARLLAATARLLERHEAELSALDPALAARDCRVITKALVEADMGSERPPPPDLAERIVRALLGYLRGPARVGRDPRGSGSP